MIKMALRALVAQGLARGFRSYKGRKPLKRKGPSPFKNPAQWALNNPGRSFGLIAFIYLWGRTGSLIGALLASAAIVAVIVVAWAAYKAHKTGANVDSILRHGTEIRRIQGYWADALDAVNIKPIPLNDVTFDDQGDVTATVETSAHRVAASTLIKNAAQMAEIVGCRDIKITPQGRKANVKMMFSDPLAKITYPIDLIANDNLGDTHVPIGVDEDGKVVGVPIRDSDGGNLMVPTLVVGVTGSGKSGWLRAFIGGCLHKDIPVRLRVMDGPGGAELSAFKDGVGRETGGSVSIVRYESDPKMLGEMVDEQIKAMRARMELMAERGVSLHAATPEEPLDLLVIDEFLQTSISPEAKKALLRLEDTLMLGRKAAFSVIALTQMSQKERLGPIRDLFKRRVCFAQNSATETGVVFGSPDLAQRAPAHLIPEHTPGVHYTLAEGVRGIVKARVAYYDDDAIRQVVKGIGMPKVLPETEETGRKDWIVYRFWGHDKELLYVGKTSLWQRDQRLASHEREQPWWDEVDTNATTFEWHTTEAEAFQAETDAIKTEKPRYNKIHNTKNPWRRLRVVDTEEGAA